MMRTQPQPDRTRTFLLLVLVPVLLLLVLSAGVYWRLEKRVWTLGEELIAQSHVLTAAAGRMPRPSHVDSPTPGTFAQALTPLLPELRGFYSADTKVGIEVRRRCQDVRDGERPLSETPRQCHELLEHHRSLMQRALRASRTEEAGLPEGLQLFAPSAHPDAHGMLALQGILRLATLEMRLQLEAGQTDAALETCLDGLALSRDLGYGGGMVGALSSANGSKGLFSPCAIALQRASPPSVRLALRSLRRIREGLRPFSSAMHEESVMMPLSVMGRMLTPEQFEALPDLVRSLVTENASMSLADPALLEPVLMRHALLQVTRFDQRLVPLVDLPLPRRTPRIEELERGLSRSWNPFVQMIAPDYGRYAARMDKQRAEVDLLLALALVRAHHAEHGEWPLAVPPLAAQQPLLLPTDLRLQPGEGNTLQIRPEEKTLLRLKDILGGDSMRQPTLQVTALP